MSFDVELCSDLYCERSLAFSDFSASESACRPASRARSATIEFLRGAVRLAVRPTPRA
jgi:hypothetical protein